MIEVATPVIEIEKGCAARAGRSLREAVQYLRNALDDWQEKNGNDLRLQGFSSHHNVSFDLPEEQRRDNRTEKKLAHLLAYVIPVPAMLLIGNRKSLGIGVRPRGDRIEITSDFVPSPPLMIAAATLITGIVREVMTWPSYDLGILEQMKIPVIVDYEPTKHRSRKGWLAKDDCFSANPFACDIDADIWCTTTSDKRQSLRKNARTIYQRFEQPIAAVAGPFTSKLIPSVFGGRATSLLDLDSRPKEYDDVGRLCSWDDLYSEKELNRSRYERVLINSILRRRLEINGHYYRPAGMDGWDAVIFERMSDGNRKTVHSDMLKNHLGRWENSS